MASKNFDRALNLAREYARPATNSAQREQILDDISALRFGRWDSSGERPVLRELPAPILAAMRGEDR